MQGLAEGSKLRFCGVRGLGGMKLASPSLPRIANAIEMAGQNCLCHVRENAYLKPMSVPRLAVLGIRPQV